MKHESSPFLTDRQVAHVTENPPTILAFALEHMLDEEELFSSKEQKLITCIKEKGVDNVTEDERHMFTEVHNAWWQTIDPTLTNKQARREYIKSHAVNPEIREAHEHEKSLIEALVSKDTDALDVVREMYEMTYPEHTESIEVLFGFVHYLQLQGQVDALHKAKKTVPKEMYITLAGYQAELSNFLIREKDVSFLIAFWQGIARIAGAKEGVIGFEQFKRGILTQVAMYKVLERLGQHPELSTPEEDALSTIDLWAQGPEERKRAIQIKASRDNFDIIPAEEVGIPAVSIGTGKSKRTTFNTPDFASIQRSMIKVDDYARKMGEDIEGVFIILPLEHIDSVTGEPDEKLIENVAEKLKISMSDKFS